MGAGSRRGRRGSRTGGGIGAQARCPLSCYSSRRARTKSTNPGSSLSTRSISSPAQLHRSTTAQFAEISTGRQTAPFSSQSLSSRIVASRATSTRRCRLGPRAGRVVARPGRDLTRPLDHPVIVGDEHGDPVVARQLLHLPPTRAQAVDAIGQPSKPVGQLNLRLMPRVPERVVGDTARMPTRPGRRLPGAVADVELHGRRLRPERLSSSSGGGTRTHNPSVNSRMLCLIELPRITRLIYTGAVAGSDLSPASTSAWQLEHRRMHLRASERARSSERVMPAPAFEPKLRQAMMRTNAL